MYDDAEVLADRINEYFRQCYGGPPTNPNELPSVPTGRPTVTGLALFLGIESRKSLNDYAKKDEFSYSIKRALLVIENGYENMLPDAKGAGVIFALKNMGWEDKSQIDNNVNLRGKAPWLGQIAKRDGLPNE